MCEMCSIVRRGYLKKNVQCEVHEQIKPKTKTTDYMYTGFKTFLIL